MEYIIFIDLSVNLNIYLFNQLFMNYFNHLFLYFFQFIPTIFITFSCNFLSYALIIFILDFHFYFIYLLYFKMKFTI